MDHRTETGMREVDMSKLVTNFIVFVFLSNMLASIFIKVTGLTFWWGGGFLAVLGALLYLTSKVLMIYFLKKNAPRVLEFDLAYGKPMPAGEYLWEKTAGTGIVPKWVSWLGLVSMSCFAGLIMWIMVWLW